MLSVFHMNGSTKGNEWTNATVWCLFHFKKLFNWDCQCEKVKDVTGLETHFLISTVALIERHNLMMEIGWPHFSSFTIDLISY